MIGHARFGEIYSVTRKSDEEGHRSFVLVLLPNEPSNGLVAEAVVVVPVSKDVVYAAEGDLLVTEPQGSLEAPFMVQTWHQIGVLTADLGEQIGRLSPKYGKALWRLWARHEGLSPEISDLQDTGMVHMPAPGHKDKIADFRRRQIDQWSELGSALDKVISAVEESQGEEGEVLGALLDGFAVEGADRAKSTLARVSLKVGSSLRSAWDHFRGLAQTLVPGLVATTALRPLAEPVRLAGEVQGPFRVRVEQRDGRLAVTVRETDAGALVAEVTTPKAEDAGGGVRIVLLGPAEVLVEDVVLQRQGQGSRAGHVFGAFDEVVQKLGGEFAVVATLLMRGEGGGGQASSGGN